MDREPKRIIIILVSIIIMFLSLIVYLTWFQVFRADDVKKHSYNKRLWINEEKILRGSISDRNGVSLVRSERNPEDQSTRRIYEHGSLYSHVLGYSYREYGKSALELKYNDILLGLEDSSTINEIKNMVAEEQVGNSIKTTLDHGMQIKSRELLQGKKGSIVAMNPKTGEVYSMVSLPDFNVANLREEWKELSEDISSPLLNRATQGLYEPGSTFKMLVASSIVNNPEVDQNFICKGSVVIDGYTFSDYNPNNPHGNINLNTALTKSCNTYFAKKSVELGKEKLGKTADSFMMNQKIPFELPVEISKFNYKEKMEETEIGASGIGQGRVLMTPINMAIMTSGIVNDGELMQPTLIKEIISKDGKLMEEREPKKLSDPITANQSANLREILGNVVANGTGKNAQIAGISVGGKTGTAQNKSGKDHAWFAGFAPVENPEIVVVVILEEDGNSGGVTAAPIAREIIKYGLENIR